MKTVHSPSLGGIRITDDLFGHYVRLAAEKILPYQWMVLNDAADDVEPSHCIEHFRIAAGEMEGIHNGPVFCDTDAYKWLEAVAYCIESGSVEEFETIADELIDLIGRAQQPDGYLNTWYTVVCPEKKWANLAEGHELYCAGHLIEAAAAYYKATGKEKLLNIAQKNADLIYRVFITEKHPGYPGHSEIELALVKLYRITGKKQYLDLAAHFIDERGKKPNFLISELQQTGNDRIFPEFRDYDESYAQSQTRPAEQTTAEGHAVRAMYLFSAMADIAAETGDRELEEACKRLWKNVTEKRMYITGGLGSSGHLERFTCDYDLPNDRMYCESCASIGLIMFGKRMAEMTGDASYYDVVERALCNTVLASLSMEGDRYFYVNPLEVHPENCMPGTSMAHVKPVRQPWYHVACCPPNIARTLTSLGQYIYAVDEKGIFINMLISSELQEDGLAIQLNNSLFMNGKAVITGETDHPALVRVRIPQWVNKPCVSIDGKSFMPETAGGYAIIPLDTGSHRIELSGEIFPAILSANEEVYADTGKIAIQYGPFIYCLEETDNGKNLSSVSLSPDAEFQLGKGAEALPGEMPVLKTKGMRLRNQSSGKLYDVPHFKYEPFDLTAVPYAVWGNRKPGEMTVWIRALI